MYYLIDCLVLQYKKNALINDIKQDTGISWRAEAKYKKKIGFLVPLIIHVFHNMSECSDH